MNKQDNQGVNQPHPLIANSMEAELLSDLPLTAGQAAGTKAGIAGGTAAAAGEIPYIISFQDTATGLYPKPLSTGLSSNHNETVAADADENNTASAQLTDLPMTTEQAQQAKGGTDQLSVNYTKIQFTYRP